jgi:hypothetical protein
MKRVAWKQPVSLNGSLLLWKGPPAGASGVEEVIMALAVQQEQARP